MAVELGAPVGIVSAEAAIEIEGELYPELVAGLVSLVVEETTDGLYRCEARFGNWGSVQGAPGYLYFDREVLDFGSELVVRMGAADSSDEIFRGRISALEAQYSASAPPGLVVLAEDQAQSLRVKRRTRVFEDMSDADVFDQIARDNSLQAEIDVSGPTHAILAQVNQSDLAFIRARARAVGAEVWLSGSTLHVQPRSQRAQGGEEFVLALGAGLLEFSVTADTANQYTSVVVGGWDTAAKEQIREEADESALGSELNGTESGSSIVSGAFGDRADTLAHHTTLTTDEARALAEAAFRAQARRFVAGRGVARGDARLRVGEQVRLDGLGRMFSGTYAICEVQHIFSRGPDGGYTTVFAVERPGVGS
jgi:phage protein D